jgi:hypothetical protein
MNKQPRSLGYADPFWTKKRINEIRRWVTQRRDEREPQIQAFNEHMRGVGAIQNSCGDWNYNCGMCVGRGVTFQFDESKRDLAGVVDVPEKRRCPCWLKFKKIEDVI